MSYDTGHTGLWDEQTQLFSSGKGLVSNQESYDSAYTDSYNRCSKSIPDNLTEKERRLRTDKCRAVAAKEAGMAVRNLAASEVSDAQNIKNDINLAQNYEKLANLSRQFKGLAQLKYYGASELGGGVNPFLGALKGGGKGIKGLGGSLAQALKCNPATTLLDAAEIVGSGYLGNKLAHEICYTCKGNYVQESNKGTGWIPFVGSHLDKLKPEKPYLGSPDDAPIPRWTRDFVKPYCFVPNRRGGSGYCPIFGNTQKLEKKDPNWATNDDPEFQKYQASILGTTDYEFPAQRPFWTLKDTYARIQTAATGLHTQLTGDTDPRFWGKPGGLEPAVDGVETAPYMNLNDGARKWTNYGYVCNYNHTDDFVTNPIQAQNFLDMTVGPIHTLNPGKSGALTKTCTEPLVLNDLRQLSGDFTSSGRPSTVYSRVACEASQQDSKETFGTQEFSQMTVAEKIGYYFKNPAQNRYQVLGMGDAGGHYAANIIPVPSDPNIPYNQNFATVELDSGGTSLLPDQNPKFSGQSPWFTQSAEDYTPIDYEKNTDPETATYKLPSTYWYEHDTFNKVMADYCVRSGPKIGHPDSGDNYDAETATATTCLLMGGVNNTPPSAAHVPGSPNSVRTYCPNMFLSKAGMPNLSPSRIGEDKSSLTDFCYNCSSQETIALVPNIPMPTDVCGRWYKGMIDAYENLSVITKQNPTGIFKEYNKAVEEYCNVPEHRDLQECACANADNPNNPSQYNKSFELWSTLENTNIGTKGMKYCWLTPCMPAAGEFESFQAEGVPIFKDPGAYVNSARQDGASPWLGKCPKLACEEFLVFTEGSTLTDTDINEGIHSCGKETVANTGWACEDGKCVSAGRYVGADDPAYSRTEATCKEKCLAKYAGGPACVQQYWECRDGKLDKSNQYSSFWSGMAASPGSCDRFIPRTGPPSNQISIIDVSDPEQFRNESEKCIIGPYEPADDSDYDAERKGIAITLIIVVGILCVLLCYILFIRHSPKSIPPIKSTDSSPT